MNLSNVLFLIAASFASLTTLAFTSVLEHPAYQFEGSGSITIVDHNGDPRIGWFHSTDGLFTVLHKAHRHSDNSTKYMKFTGTLEYTNSGGFTNLGWVLVARALLLMIFVLAKPNDMRPMGYCFMGCILIALFVAFAFTILGVSQDHGAYPFTSGKGYNMVGEVEIGLSQDFSKDFSQVFNQDSKRILFSDRFRLLEILGGYSQYGRTSSLSNVSSLSEVLIRFDVCDHSTANAYYLIDLILSSICLVITTFSIPMMFNCQRQFFRSIDDGEIKYLAT